MKFAKEQLIGFGGSAALIVGIFTPLVSFPIVGDMTFWNLLFNDTNFNDGDNILSICSIAILAFGIISAVLAYLKKYKFLWVTGLASLVAILAPFIRIKILIADASAAMKTSLEGNMFAGLGDLVMQTIKLQWGWGVLVIGALLLLAAAWTTRDQKETMKKVSTKLHKNKIVKNKKLMFLIISAFALLLCMALTTIFLIPKLTKPYIKLNSTTYQCEPSDNAENGSCNFTITGEFGYLPKGYELRVDELIRTVNEPENMKGTNSIFMASSIVEELEYDFATYLSIYGEQYNLIQLKLDRETSYNLNVDEKKHTFTLKIVNLFPVEVYDETYSLTSDCVFIKANERPEEIYHLKMNISKLNDEQNGGDEHIYAFQLDELIDFKFNDVAVEQWLTVQNEQCTVKKQQEQKALEDGIANATTVGYLDLFRNSDNHLGNFYKFTGKVLQTISDGDCESYRIATKKTTYSYIKNSYIDDVIFADDCNNVSGKILEDDVVSFVGQSDGNYTYQATFGQSIEIPKVNIVNKIEFVEHDD